MDNTRIAPCYHCTDRAPLCHSACPRYAEHCEQRKEARRQRQEPPIYMEHEHGGDPDDPT